jgi:hypothetical protein
MTCLPLLVVVLCMSDLMNDPISKIIYKDAIEEMFASELRRGAGCLYVGDSLKFPDPDEFTR